jgi:hypothetical protein
VDDVYVGGGINLNPIDHCCVADVRPRNRQRTRARICEFAGLSVGDGRSKPSWNAVEGSSSETIAGGWTREFKTDRESGLLRVHCPDQSIFMISSDRLSDRAGDDNMTSKLSEM